LKGVAERIPFLNTYVMESGKFAEIMSPRQMLELRAELW
jgi:hypothetical protein